MSNKKPFLKKKKNPQPSKNQKRLIIVGFALIILSFPISFLATESYIPSDCSDNMLVSLCTDGTRIVYAVCAGIVGVLAGLVVIAVGFSQKR